MQIGTVLVGDVVLESVNMSFRDEDNINIRMGVLCKKYIVQFTLTSFKIKKKKKNTVKIEGEEVNS